MTIRELHYPRDGIAQERKEPASGEGVSATPSCDKCNACGKTAYVMERLQVPWGGTSGMFCCWRAIAASADHCFGRNPRTAWLCVRAAPM